MGLHVVRQALGGHADGVFVHAVGANAHDAAQTARSEFQVAVEGIFETGRIIVPEFEDLTFGLRIEISVEPTLGYFFVITCHSVIVWFLFACRGFADPIMQI